VLDVPARGCFNIHASLLPRWRGAAPIHRAIEAGDAQTGVTIMQMDAGLDTGAMLLAQAIPIEAGDTTGSLHDRLAELGAQLMLQVLAQAVHGSLQPVAQAAQGVTYAHKIEKHEAVIDWTQAAAVITQRIRAFNPFPGATAVLNGETLKVWLA
jgi:methionyl-tRNA formyltransferase